MSQLKFNFESLESQKHLLANSGLSVPTPENLYGSVKRVFLVYEGSLQDRPCITGTDEAKRLFKNYWKQHPANDQEQFVIACLDTKHRVQCVVRITVGTLDASLVHPREVFKPALIEGSAGSYPRPFLSPSTALYRTLTADYAFRIPITFHVPFNGTCDCTADALPSMGGPHHSLRTVLPIDCCGFGPLLGKDAHWAKTFKKGESYGIRYVRLQDSRSN